MASPLIKRYLLAVNRYKWVIPTGVAVGLGAAAVVAVQPEAAPIYQAGATLVSNAPPITFSTIGTQVRQPIETFTAETLLTKEVIEGTAKEVALDPRSMAKQITVKIAGGEETDAKGGGKSQVQISYEDADQKRAADVIQQLSQRIIEQSRLNNSARLRAVIQAIEQRLPQVKNELQIAEQRLETFDRTAGPQLLAAQDGTVIKSITASQQQVRQLQIQLDGINAQIRSIQEKLGLNSNQAYVASALSADPIIANLRAQIQQVETQMSILSKDLRPEHPQMETLRKQQQGYEAELNKRAAEVVAGGGIAAPLVGNVRQDSSLDPARQQLANTLVNLKTQQEALQQQLVSTARAEQELRQEYTNLPNKQLERVRLEDQLKLKKNLHDQMQQKLVDAKAAEVETVSSLSLGKPPAVAPTTLRAPKSLPMTLAVGGIVGLLVGAGLVFLLDTLEGTFYTEEDLREAIRQRDVVILGGLPKVKSFLPGSSPVLVKPGSPYAEYYERFRSNLRLADHKAPRVVMVISTVGNEGKTVTAYNLAIASARAGKRTVLIEGDLRSPSSAHYVGLSPDADSQIEPLRYYGQMDCIRLAPDVENLYVIPSVGPQQQAASILESSEMRRVLEDARGRFDLVVLDSTSLSRCNDALLLEPFTDGMILVTRPGVTQQSLLEEAIDQLNESDNLRLLGAVTNGVEVQLPRAVEDAMLAEAEEFSSTNGIGVRDKMQEATAGQ